MAIEVGDAVLRFLGDSSQLDTKFDEVQPNAEKAFGSAAEAVEEGTGRMKNSMYEARGEAGLLGEAFGVHLPRHVRSFIAELPGVGNALTAAFSATAVLFIASAIVDVTKKVVAFIADMLIYTEAMKESNKATVETNKALLEQSAAYDKAKESIEKFGATGSDAQRLALISLKEQIAQKKEDLATGEQQNQQQRSLVHEYIQQHSWLSRGYDVIKAWVTGGKNQVDTIKLQTAEIQNRVLLDNATIKALQEQQALLEKQLETEHRMEDIRQQRSVQSASLNAQRAAAEAAVSLDDQTAQKRQAIKEHFEDMQYKLEVSSLHKQLAILKENDENTKDQQAKLYAELQAMAFKHEQVVSERLTKAKDELLKTLNEMEKGVQAAGPIEIVQPASVQRLLNFINTSHNAGIVLRQDLVQGVKAAQRALDEFGQSGIRDQQQFKVLVDNLHKAKAALDAFGQDEEKFKSRTESTWQNFQFEMKNGANAMANLSQLGKEAFDNMALGLQQAIQTAILASGSFGQALEKATAQALASLASQALVKALFYTAEGFAALASLNYGSAGQYFAAAGEMAAVGAAAGLTAHALSGGSDGGGRRSNAQSHDTVSNTGQTNRSGSGAVGVQHFATGGLITAPTLAIMGEESKSEAVLPLEDPHAMNTIGEAVSKYSSGGLTVHVNGLVSDDKLVKIMGKMSKLVMQGKAQLHASNSMRVTKRSI